MKRLRRTFLAFFAATLLSPCVLSAPSLEFSRSECDFGELGPVETAEMAVSVRNVGERPVRIVRVRACCGAKAVISSSAIAPSGEAELRVSLTTGVHPGEFRKMVSVVSDDPERPLFTLQLVGRVRPESSAVGGRTGCGEAGAAATADAPFRIPDPVLVLLAASALTMFLAALAFCGASARNARPWMKRLRFPSLAAVALLLSLIGWTTWTQLRRQVRDHAGKADAATSGGRRRNAPKAAASPEPSSPLPANRLTDAELADGNDRLDALLREKEMPAELPRLLASVVGDRRRDERWRNHCLQFVPDCMLRLEENSEARASLGSVLEEALRERSTMLAGTALLGCIRLSEATGRPSAEEIAAAVVALASDSSSSTENVVTALRVGAERGIRDVLIPSRYWARRGKSAFLRCVAVSVVRDLGGPSDVAFLRSLLPSRTKAEETAVEDALRKMEALR